MIKATTPSVGGENKVLRIAAKVVASASRDKPADAVLRIELRNRDGISREEGRAISQGVFAYYRWREWLNWKEAPERQVARAIELQKTFDANPEAIPDEEMRRAAPKWISDFMEVSPEWLRSLQAAPVLWLRARPGKGRALAEKLGDCKIAGPSALSDTLCYQGGGDLFRTAQFQAGEFELQDIASQVVGLICGPRSNEAWWDACAGEGGKMLHLCDLMQNKGLVWASDRAEWRLKRLKQRAARAKLFNYRAVIWAANAKVPTRTKFDGVLVDAPCSGVGTWQRNPHARWTSGPQDVTELAEVQKDLLRRSAGNLKPGGRLIYSVCTMTRAETTEVVQAISAEAGLMPMALTDPTGQGIVEGNQFWLWPYAADGNGMFIAAWTKQ